jgi:hypothetical protein
MSNTIELPGYVQGSLGSSALLDISTAAIKNLPYAFLAEELHCNDLTNLLTSKISYGEVLLRSTASTVYNFAVGTIFLGLSILSLGQISSIYTATRKFWIYTTLSAMSVGVAALGVISSRAAIMATLLVISTSVVATVELAQNDILAMTKKCFQLYKPQLAESAPNLSIEALEKRIMKASSLKELASSVMEVIKNQSQNR